MDKSGSAAALNADIITATEARRFAWFSLQITGTFVGTITIQGSNNNSDWVSVLTQSPSESATASATMTTTGVRVGPVNYSYMRVRMTAYTSGTATGKIEFFESLRSAPGANAAVVNSNGLLGAVVYGYDGSANPAMATDTSGRPKIYPGTAIGDGRTVVTTAGTRVVLAASTACKSVAITAETDNTGVIVVGGTTVVAALGTRRGTPLNAGETLTLDIDDLNKINLDSTVNGDGVTYTYTN